MRVEAISTERLVLREWRPSDREPFADMNADSAVMEHFPRVMTRGESDALIQSFIAHWMEYGFGRYAVEVADSAVFIGFVGVMVPRFDAPFMPAVEIA